MPMSAQQLGQLIFDENPYSSSSNPMKPEDVVETQKDPGTWQFKGAGRLVEKAIRVPYQYTDHQGHVIRDHLLIGFEGGGAY